MAKRMGLMLLLLLFLINLKAKPINQAYSDSRKWHWTSWDSRVTDIALLTGGGGVMVFLLIYALSVRRKYRRLHNYDRKKIGNLEKRLLYIKNYANELTQPVKNLMSTSDEILHNEQMDKEMSYPDALNIYQNTKKISHLVGQIHYFGKHHANRLTLKAQKRDMHVLMKHCICNVEASIPDNQGKIILNMPLKPVYVWFDIRKMEIVLNHICEQAIRQAQPHNLIYAAARVLDKEEKRLSLPGQELEIAIYNQGYGFRESDGTGFRGPVIQEGTPVNQNDNPDIEFIRSLVELHGGSFNMHSHPEKGIAFSIVLPMGKSHLLKQELAGMEEVVQTPLYTGYLHRNNKHKLVYTRHKDAYINQFSRHSKDDQFMQKVNEIINDNLSDTSFTVAVLSQELNLSSTQVYRKIKDLTGHSTVEYIRIKRLDKAAEILRENNHLVKEVCYQIGFNSFSYFVKCFKQYYGITPMNYKEDFEPKTREPMDME